MQKNKKMLHGAIWLDKNLIGWRESMYFCTMEILTWSNYNWNHETIWEPINNFIWFHYISFEILLFLKILKELEYLNAIKSENPVDFEQTLLAPYHTVHIQREQLDSLKINTWDIMWRWLFMK